MNVIPQRVKDGFVKLIGPLARLLIKAGVDPNAITTVGTLVVIGSGVAFGTGAIRLGGLLLLISGIFDLLDGQVARQGGKMTTFGAFYDSTLDRVGEGAVFAGLIFYFFNGPLPADMKPRALAAGLVALVASLLVSYTRGRAETPGVQKKGGIWAGRGRLLVLRGRAVGIGSLSRMATIRLGKRTEKRMPKIKEFVPLADLNDLVFAAWDPIPDDAFTAAVKAGVLDRHEHLEPIKDFLQNIKPMPAVFDQYYVKRLQGTNVKRGTNKRELAEQLREDMRTFKERAKLDRLVVVWCASTEVFLTPGPAHQSLAAFEMAMEQNDQAIAPSMLYAYAALMENVPFANGAPNLTVDLPVMERLAEERHLPIGGQDLQSGPKVMTSLLA